MSELVPPERMRVSDGERKTVVERLQAAHDEGRITLHEFDERVQAVWRAQTYGELAGVTADLPSVQPVLAPRPVHRVRKRNGRRLALRIVTMAWFTVTLVNLVTWGLVSAAAGHFVYAWWVWVAGPFGAVVLAGYLTGFARDRYED